MNDYMRATLAGLLILSSLFTSQAAEFSQIRPDEETLSELPTTNWLTNGGDLFNRNFSALTEINTGNVNQLGPVWRIHLDGSGIGAKYSGEAQPIVYEGVMYIITGADDVFALSIETGKVLWRYSANLSDEISTVCCGWTSRGVGFGEDKIFVGQLDGILKALDKDSGAEVWSIQAEAWEEGYTITSAPLYFQGMVITGFSGAEFAARGRVKAYSAEDGSLLWTFYTVPGPDEFGHDTWPADNDAWQTGGGTVWHTPAVDPELGMIYFSTGNPGPDYNGSERAGDNLFTASIVALDAYTGDYRWHFQEVHHDIWDYDAQSAPLVVDLRRDGEIVPAVIIVNKTGLMFTLNRVTGEPIFDVEERPVPQSDVPGEQASPTQPFPVKPEPLTQNTISRDNLYKGEFEHQAYCERLVDDNNMKLGGPYMPITPNQYSISPPGPAGGINYWGPSYDPELHLFVSNTTNLFQPMRLVQRPNGTWVNSGPLAGVRRFGDPDRRLPCGPTPWGELVAVDMGSGDIAYRKTLGVSDMLPSGMQDTGRPSTGGVVLTASGLTFVGGTDDFRFRAFRTATGEQLWELRLPSSVETTPITYLGADGRQFVTVVSTGGGLTGSEVTNDEIITFALPKN